MPASESRKSSIRNAYQGFLWTRPATSSRSSPMMLARRIATTTSSAPIFNTGVDAVRIGQRRFQMPDSLELPGVGCAVVPLVSAGLPLVGELVAYRRPRLAAVVGTLDQLPEPAAGL